jgi:subtilisin family serine protease
VTDEERPVSRVVEWGLVAVATLWFVGLPLAAAGAAVLASESLSGAWDQTLVALVAGGLQLGGLLVATALGKLLPGRNRLFTIGLVLSLAAAWSLLTTLTAPLAAGDLLRLLLGVPTLLGLGGWLVAQVRSSSLREAWAEMGLTRPGSIGWGLAAAALVVWPWLVVGALGDASQSASLAFGSIVNGLLTEGLWRGLALALLLAVAPRRRVAGLLGALLYSAYEIGILALGQGELGIWETGTALALAFLTTELWARPGPGKQGIWGAVLFHSLYLGFPRLFADGRLELEAAHLAARVYMPAATLLIAVALYAGRKLQPYLAPKPQRGAGDGLQARPSRARIRWPALVAAVLWTLALIVYLALGNPGFANDGYLIILKEQADPTLAADIPTREGRLVFLHTLLVETAERSQTDLRAALDDLGVPYRPYYLVNMIRVDGTQRGMKSMAERPDVAQVIGNPNVRQYPLTWQVPYWEASTEAAGMPWGVDQIDAEQVWRLGITGQGIVVAGQDSGYDWDHPALQDSYRGWDGRRAEHNGNWHDAWDDTPEPFDDDKHGTHTMGTAVGNVVGVAPDAQWIGCRNMRHGLGNPGSYVECMEFLFAPYPVGGDPFRDGDPLLAPHVINNSWGCPPEEGCIGPEPIHTAVEVLRAAGIMMVVSAGNEGPACGTVWLPASEDAVFSVGASEKGDHVVTYSSRGPTADGLIKPDVVAPGVDIRSSIPGDEYANSEGTSMAGPHVAGLVALLWSANPDLIGDIGHTEEIIAQTAVHPSEYLQADACGAGGSPNNTYGYGLVDALAAVKAALALAGE